MYIIYTIAIVQNECVNFLFCCISQTIAPPEEETPSTPLTPTATLKPVVQSQDGTKHHAQSPHGTKPPVQSNDGAKPSDNGATVSGDTDETKSKPVVVPKQEAPKPKQSKDIKLKTVASAKSEPGAKTEAKPSAGKEAEPEKEKQGGGGVLDLLTDTTAQHGEHIYHPQCQICLGKKSPPPAKAETPHDEEYYIQSSYIYVQYNVHCRDMSISVCM